MVRKAAMAEGRLTRGVGAGVGGAARNRVARKGCHRKATRNPRETTALAVTGRFRTVRTEATPMTGPIYAPNNPNPTR